MTQPLVLHAAEETLEAVHNRRHAAYPAYKPSGVEWLGDVPKHWEVKRLKFLSRINPSASEVMGLRDEDEVSFVPMDAIGEYGGMRLNTDKRLDEVRSGFTYFRDEDVVIAKITPCFENGKGGIARHLTNGVAFGTTELHVVRTGPKFGVGFLFYLTISDAFRRLGASEMYGAGGQKRVPTDFVRDFPVGLPPLEEQQAIARFLDEQTRKIDDLIEAKRSLLDLLKEKRQAVITHAVTRGLDPAAKLKPSGVEWLGDVPEHWDVKSLKYVTSIKSGENITYESIDSIGNYPVYGGNGVRGYTSEHTHDGDFVLIGRQGALCGNVHAASGRIWASEHCAVATPKKVSVRWLRSLLEVMDLRQYSETAAQPGLAVEKVLRLRVPYPSIAEQKIIAGFLDEETEKIDDLESVVREAIETLELLRASIISSAVTGKIDVREEGV